MKRIISLVLSLLMIFTLVSCSKTTEEIKETEGVDLSALDGEMLYRYGEDKMRMLNSALYTTKVLLGTDELGEFETVRIRRGYDGFIYSRYGQDFYSFDGKTAYVETELGAYKSPATSRIFEEYQKEFIFSVCALDPDSIENFSRDGEKVTYESTDAQLLSLYRLAEKPDFVPTSLSGVAVFDKEGVIREESLTLKNETETFVLKTTLTNYRSDTIKIAAPEHPNRFAEVEDIRLPYRLQTAFRALYDQKEIQTTGTDSNSLSYGGIDYIFYTDVNTYAKQDAGAYYISRHSLKRVTNFPDESIFYQALLKDGTKNENRYNVILGEKLWENSEAANTLPWEEQVRALLPELSDFASLSHKEEVGGYNVSFELTRGASEKIGLKIAAMFLDSGIAVQSTKILSATGTLSVETDRGMVTTISYTVEGEITTAEGTGQFKGQYSVLVDQTEGVTLPEMQSPTPTTPGMDTPEIHNDIC